MSEDLDKKSGKIRDLLNDLLSDVDGLVDFSSGSSDVYHPNNDKSDVDELLDFSSDRSDDFHLNNDKSDIDEILDFSSGRSDDFHPNNDYESDDSRRGSVAKKPRLASDVVLPDLAVPSPSTSHCPVMTLTLLSSSEDEDDPDPAMTLTLHSSTEDDNDPDPAMTLTLHSSTEDDNDPDPAMTLTLHSSTEDDDDHDPAMALTLQSGRYDPPPKATAVPWVRVSDDEPEVDLRTEFTIRNSGPRDCPINHTPIEYFKMFVTESILQSLVRETNIYAQKQIKKKRRANKISRYSQCNKWLNVTLNEMKKYLAILLWMGVCQLKNLADYWSTDPALQFPFVKTLMSSSRFKLISSFLHLSSQQSAPKGTASSDPWGKIRPLLDAVNKSFVKHFVPSQNLSLDESMVGMKNKSAFIQYMPKKRYMRYGIKKFELVDASTMYVMQISLYSGKDFLENNPVPLTQKVILDLLARGKCLDKGYHVFTNTFCTKLPLACELLDRKTFLTGMINKNSNGLPKNLVSADFTFGKPVCYRQGQLLVVGFKEKSSRRPVFLVSTACESRMKPVKNSDGNVTSKPVVVHKYKKFMGGVDGKNKSLYHISCTRATRKYWKKLFFNLIDTCVQNAYILYSQQCKGLGSVLSRTKFLLSIINSLATVKQQVPRPSLTYYDAQGVEHRFTTIPNKSKKVCAVCFNKATHWCPACNCGVHKHCFPNLEHRYRPKGTVRKPRPTSDSESD